MALRIDRPMTLAAILSGLVAVHPAAASTTLAGAGTMRLTPTEIQGKSLDQIASLLGEPSTTEFVLDQNVSAFRSPLLQLFDATQSDGAGVTLLEATFPVDQTHSLTVWYNGDEYVDHFLHENMSDY